MSMMFRVKYGQSLGRVLLSDIHQGWLTRLLKMMRANTNTSHDEDDEDNIDNRLGRKSESKVRKIYRIDIRQSYVSLFYSLIHNSRKKKLSYKGFIMNEWILYQKEGLLLCMQSFQTSSISPWQYTSHWNISWVILTIL